MFNIHHTVSNILSDFFVLSVMSKTHELAFFSFTSIHLLLSSRDLYII